MYLTFLHLLGTISYQLIVLFVIIIGHLPPFNLLITSLTLLTYYKLTFLFVQIRMTFYFFALNES